MKQLTPNSFQSNHNSDTSKIKLKPGYLFQHGSLRSDTLYLQKYNKIPNYIELKFIDVKEAHIWFVENYKKEIIDSYFTVRQLEGEQQQASFDDVFYFFADDGLIYFNHNSGNIEIYFRETDYATITELQQSLFKFLNDFDKTELGLITAGMNGPQISKIELDQKEVDLQMNYNHSLQEVHDTILSRLNRQNDKGLVLLHGLPGTGKTTYIRHLISVVKKEVLFISAQMAVKLDSPEFLSLLLEHKNAILVIEDAEKILNSRDYDSNSPVAALLNLTDGLLSECLNIQIICSFNTDLSSIDKALLRKGRLIAKYEFDLLAVDKANTLAAHLGHETEFPNPMSLTEIFNLEATDFGKEKKTDPIGFHQLN
jgi:energy-coupling factor transporter ATP-binding protein EcfA2